MSSRFRILWTNRGFAVCSVAAVLVLVVITAFTLPNFLTEISSPATQEGAKEALGLLKDTTVWLASIQTATLATLGLITKDGVTSLKPTPCQIKLAVLVAVFNSFALFFSAWVLTALPSVMLRVYSAPAKNYDFFNLAIYNFLNDGPFQRIFTVHFCAFCNHWLWGMGVLLFGWLYFANGTVFITTD